MKKLQTLLLLPLGLSVVSCVGQTWLVEAGPMFARARGDLALQNAGGSLDLGSNQNSVDGNLGLGDQEVMPFVRAQMDKDRHRVKLNGMGISTDGAGVLAGDFGGLVAGSQVTTSMDVFAATANYGYQLLREEHYRVAVGGQLAFYGLDVTARSTAGYEQVKTDAILPMPSIEVEGFFGPVTVGANGSAMSAHIGDGNGIYLDVDLYARVKASEQFELLAGYRYLSFDAFGTASDRDFDAEIEVQGWFFGAGVRF